MFIGSQAVVFEGTPMTEEDLIANRLSSMGVFVYELDTNDNAAVAFERLSDGLAGSLVGLNGGTGDEELTYEELADIGTQAALARLVISDEANATTNEVIFEYVTVQRDQYVFVVTVQSNRGPYEGSLPAIGDLPSPAIALATDLAANGQPGSEEAVFSEDGTSTGGLWGFMPDKGDPLLVGLTPYMDFVQYPAPRPLEAAQGQNETVPPRAEDLAGLQAAVRREYLSPDVVVVSGPVVFDATPVIGDALAPLRGTIINVLDYEFDTASNASLAFDQLNNLDAGYQGPGTVTSDLEDLPDIGDQAVLARTVIAHEGNGLSSELIFEQVTVQRDGFVLVVNAMLRRGPVEGSLPDAGDQPGPMIALASDLAANGQPSNEEETFSEDGTSGGGLWGFMPAEGDPVLIGLIPVFDEILFPVPVR
jgi:hypothetical protein